MAVVNSAFVWLSETSSLELSTKVQDLAVPWVVVCLHRSIMYRGNSLVATTQMNSCTWANKWCQKVRVSWQLHLKPLYLHRLGLPLASFIAVQNNDVIELAVSLMSWCTMFASFINDSLVRWALTWSHSLHPSLSATATVMASSESQLRLWVMHVASQLLLFIVVCSISCRCSWLDFITTIVFMDW